MEKIKNIKNYVQVRIETKSNQTLHNTITHNIRKEKELLTNQLNNNDNILVFNNKIYNNNKDIYKQKEEINKVIKSLKDEHIKLYKENNGNRKLPKGYGSIGEGVITFSNLIEEKQKEDKRFKEHFTNLLIKNVEEIERELGTKIISIHIHLDEKSPHCHFFYKNFDNKGKSITYKNKRKEKLSKLQDIAGEVWGDYGFKRGIRKEYTHKNHIKLKNYKENEIRNINIERDKLREEIIEEYKTLIKLTKELRKDITLNNNDLNIQNKKIKYKDITKLQKILRNDIKVIKSFIDDKNKTIEESNINDILLSNLNEIKSISNKKLFSNDKITFIEEDFNKLFIKLSHNLNNLKISNSKIEELEKDNNKLLNNYNKEKEKSKKLEKLLEEKREIIKNNLTNQMVINQEIEILEESNKILRNNYNKIKEKYNILEEDFLLFEELTNTTLEELIEEDNKTNIINIDEELGQLEDLKDYTNTKQQQTKKKIYKRSINL